MRVFFRPRSPGWKATQARWRSSRGRSTSASRSMPTWARKRLKQATVSRLLWTVLMLIPDIRRSRSHRFARSRSHVWAIRSNRSRALGAVAACGRAMPGSLSRRHTSCGYSISQPAPPAVSPLRRASRSGIAPVCEPGTSSAGAILGLRAQASLGFVEGQRRGHLGRFHQSNRMRVTGERWSGGGRRPGTASRTETPRSAEGAAVDQSSRCNSTDSPPCTRRPLAGGRSSTGHGGLGRRSSPGYPPRACRTAGGAHPEAGQGPQGRRPGTHPRDGSVSVRLFRGVRRGRS